MAGITIVLKTEAALTAINQVFGFKPEAQYYETYSEIVLTPEQQKIIQDWLLLQLDKKRKPAEIRINLAPVLIPVLIRKGFPYLAGLFAGGIYIGRKTK